MKILTPEDIKNIKAEFLSSTNKQMELYFKNSISELNYINKVIWFSDMHTSYIKTIEIHNNILSVDTRNSVYVFKLLDDIFEDTFIEIDNSDIEAQLKQKGL